MSDDDVVLRCAKEMARVDGWDFDAASKTYKNDMITRATAALAALRAGDTLPNGLVVRKVPTDEDAQRAWSEFVRNAAKEV
jgi:hypothetical protein